MAFALITFAATKKVHRASAVYAPASTAFPVAEAVQSWRALILLAAFSGASAHITDGVIGAMGVGTASRTRAAGKRSIAYLPVGGFGAVGVGNALALGTTGEGVFTAIGIVRIFRVIWWGLGLVSISGIVVG